MPYSEENYSMGARQGQAYRPYDPTALTIDVMNRGTDRKIEGINRLSEENAAHKRDLGEKMAAMPMQAVRGWQQGRRFGNEMDQDERNRQFDQQRYTRSDMENENYKRGMDDDQRRRSWLTTSEEGQPPREQQQWGAEHQNILLQPQVSGEHLKSLQYGNQIAPEEHNLRMREGNANIAASGINARAAQYALTSAQEQNATKQATAIYADALASNDPNKMAEAQAKVSRLKLSDGAQAVAIADARQAVKGAAAAQSFYADNTPQGQQATAKLTQLGAKFDAASKLAQATSNYKAAAFGGDEEDAYLNNLVKTLDDMGKPELADMIESRASVSFAGGKPQFETRSQRAAKALDIVIQDLENDLTTARAMAMPQSQTQQQQVQSMQAAVDSLKAVRARAHGGGPPPSIFQPGAPAGNAGANHTFLTGGGGAAPRGMSTVQKLARPYQDPNAAPPPPRQQQPTQAAMYQGQQQLAPMPGDPRIQFAPPQGAAVQTPVQAPGPTGAVPSLRQFQVNQPVQAAQVRPQR